MELHVVHDMFSLGLPIGEKILRPIIVYAFLIVALRLAGTRELAMVERLQQRLAVARRDIGAPDPLGTLTDRSKAGATPARIDATFQYRRLTAARRPPPIPPPRLALRRPTSPLP